MSDPLLAGGAVRQRIEHLIQAQRGLIRRRLLLYGAGVVLGATASALLVYYVTDRTLLLPAGVRVLLTLGLALVAAAVLARWLLSPLRARLQRDDVAVAMERRFPQLQERLISAVQLGEAAESADLRNQSRDMIDALLEEASRSASSLRPDDLLSWRSIGRAWAAAGGSAAVALVLLAATPDYVGIFVQRMFGASVAYPRRTHLHVELPPSGPDFRIEFAGQDRARVVLAAGGDLPVLVRAEGVVPREVLLRIDGGRGLPSTVATAARGGGRFKHVFRRISEGFAFRASGGDDDYGDLEVEVVAIRPPRVGTIRAALQPPEYCGQPESVQHGGGVEALAGTRVRIQVTPIGEASAARLVFQESAEVIDLVPETYEDDDGEHKVLACQFTITRSDRYVVELESAEGLRNPHAGSYPVLMVPDAPPSGQMLLPDDGELNVALPDALVPLRVHMRDDFRLSGATAQIQAGDSDRPATVALLAPDAAVADTVATRLLRLQELAADGVVIKEGQSLSITVELTDNRAPEPQLTRLPGRTVYVVGLGDLERRIVGHFRRVRADVERALTLQLDRQQRLAELAPLIDGQGPQELQANVTALHVAQGRVQSLAERIHAALMRACSLHMLNPIDESTDVARCAELFLAFHEADTSTAAFLPPFFRQLSRAQASGQLASLGRMVDRMLDLCAAGDNVANGSAVGCVEALAEARGLIGAGPALRDSLTRAASRQREVVAGFENLLARLDEWSELQDVISTTRALRDQQRDLQARTRALSNK